eukprot:m.562977 g.562977  ORF g.562977 m.562977 type:complete len:99 (-) comp22228_c1_seq2:93-389(-)
MCATRHPGGGSTYRCARCGSLSVCGFSSTVAFLFTATGVRCFRVAFFSFVPECPLPLRESACAAVRVMCKDTPAVEILQHFLLELGYFIRGWLTSALE